MFEITKLNKDFFLNDDIFEVAHELLGKVICSNINGKYTSGIIVEVECYNGVEDKASHAYQGKRTERTEKMFMEGGTAYIYLCYGKHHLFNVVTGPEGTPKAILIRAVDPINGVDIMMYRRNKKGIDYSLTSGPGSVSQAFGITTEFNGIDITSSKQIWIEDRGYHPKEEIISSPRIGVDYAGEDAKLPYRFYLTGNKWVSKGK